MDGAANAERMGRYWEAQCKHAAEFARGLEAAQQQDRNTIGHLRSQLRTALAVTPAPQPEDAAEAPSPDLQRQTSELDHLRRKLKGRAAMDRTCRLVAAQAVAEVESLRDQVVVKTEGLAEAKQLGSKERRNHRATKQELLRLVALVASLKAELAATTEVLQVTSCPPNTLTSAPTCGVSSAVL